MKIGIMGGTFDPIHIGHLIIAEHAREMAELDEVWFMPSSLPPHKSNDNVTGASDRLSMVEAATAGNPMFRVCDIELERGGTSYTVETAKALIGRYPEHRFSWIIGADMIAYLPNWHRIDELIQAIGFIGLQRPGYENAASGLPEALRKSVHMVVAPQLEISSTDIRDRIRDGRSVRYLLQESVLRIIEEKKLYGS